MLNPSNKHNGNTAITVMTGVFIAVVAILVTGCHKPMPPQSSFVHLPQHGWQQAMPITFDSLCAGIDSTTLVDLSVAIRHDNTYPYRNLALAIDVIACDSSVTRHMVNMALADPYGNWAGGGFGALYQQVQAIAQGIPSSQVRTVVVWQAMQACDTLTGVTDMGITVTPR